MSQHTRVAHISLLFLGYVGLLPVGGRVAHPAFLWRGGDFRISRSIRVIRVNPRLLFWQLTTFPKSGKSGYQSNLHPCDTSCVFPFPTPPSKLETFRPTAIVLDIFSRAPAERIGFWF